MPDLTLALVQPSWPWLLAVAVSVVLALTSWGFVLLRLLPGMRLSHDGVPTFCQSLVVGVLVYSVAALGGVLLLRVGILPTFWVVSAGVAVAAVATLRKPQRAVAGSVRASPVAALADRRLQSIALGLIVAGSLLWSVNNIQGLRAAEGGAVLVPWVDILVHSRLIGNFAAFSGDLGTLHLTLYGEPVPPYHYAGYMVPALVLALSGAASFQVGTSVYPVLGMLLTGAAMLVLAQATMGARAALLATALLFFLPDPTSWFPSGDTYGDKFTSYFLFQQVGIGGSYAVGVIGLALAYVMRGWQVQSRTFCVLSLCLFTAAALFKVQVFLAYGLFFVLLVIREFPRLPRAGRVGAAVACVLAFVAAVWLLDREPGAPTLWLSTSGLFEYLAPTARAVSGSQNPPAAVTIALLPVAAVRLFTRIYGVLFVAAVVLAWLLRKDADSRTTILLLTTFLLAHLCVRLLIADNRGIGDAGEINRKTFILPYFVVVYGVARLLARYVALRPGLEPKAWLLATAACGLLALTVSSATQLQHAAKARGMFTELPFASGLISSAVYLKGHSPPFEVAQLCENDKYNALATWSERPVYVARVMVNAAPETAVERARFTVVANSLQQPDLRSARAALKESGVRWLLMSPACRAAWEPALAPAFATGGWRLYEIPL